MPARQVKEGTAIASSLGRVSFATAPKLVPHRADVRELGAESPGEVVPSTVPGSDVPLRVHQWYINGTADCYSSGSDYIEWSAGVASRSCGPDQPWQASRPRTLDK